MPGFRALVATAAAALILAGGGCATLPDARQVEDLRHLQAVEVSNARGPLSAKRSAAVIATLKAKAGDLDILDRHVAIEQEITGAPLVAGNAVTLLQDGPATYQSLFAAMAAAKDHINVEFFIIDDDEVGNRFADALIQHAERGVRVQLVYDSVGCIRTPKPFFERLRAGGVRVLEFNPVNPAQARKGWRVNHRDHRKLVIVDGRVAFLGGINISSVYASGSGSGAGGGSFGRSGEGTASGGGPRRGEDPQSPIAGMAWRDTHLRVEGPVVAEFQKLFLETWKKQKGDELPAGAAWFPEVKPAGKELVRAIGSSPDDPQSTIYLTLLSAINSAEKTIFMSIAYFVPDPQLLAALRDAAARKVDVRIILPSVTDFWAVFHAGRSHYSDLLASGVKIYEREGAVLHSKTVVVDGVWSTIGSTNLDWRSFLHNDEVNAVVLGKEFGAQMERMFELDRKASTAVERSAWENRGPGLRFREWAARMWEYWL